MCPEPAHIPKRESGDERRIAIARAARALIIEKGLEGLRTRDIAERVGINIATLHYHVPSKEALVALVAASLRDDFKAQALRHPKEGLDAGAQLRQEFNEFREIVAEMPELIGVLSELVDLSRRDPTIAEIILPMQAFWTGQFTKIFRTGIDDGSFRPNIDPPPRPSSSPPPCPIAGVPIAAPRLNPSLPSSSAPSFSPFPIKARPHVLSSRPCGRCTTRSAPLDWPLRAADRQFHESDRRHHRQRRSPLNARKPRRYRQPDRMGRRRLCARLCARAPALRPPRRHLGAHPPLPLGRCCLHGRLGALRYVDINRNADRGSHHPGSRRRHDDPAGPRHRHRHLPAA